MHGRFLFAIFVSARENDRKREERADKSYQTKISMDGSIKMTLETLNLKPYTF